MSLYVILVGSNARGKSRPEKGAVSAQKALQGSETETRELLGGTDENSVSPMRGSLICPPGKSMIFHKKETEKNCVARPGSAGEMWSEWRQGKTQCF